MSAGPVAGRESFDDAFDFNAFTTKVRGELWSSHEHRFLLINLMLRSKKSYVYIFYKAFGLHRDHHRRKAVGAADAGTIR